MIVGVLLLLCLWDPLTGRVHAETHQMRPSGVLSAMGNCEQAKRAFLDRGRRIDEDAPPDPSHLNRSASCITVSAQGAPA